MINFDPNNININPKLTNFSVVREESINRQHTLPIESNDFTNSTDFINNYLISILMQNAAQQDLELEALEALLMAAQQAGDQTNLEASKDLVSMKLQLPPLVLVAIDQFFENLQAIGNVNLDRLMKQLIDYFLKLAEQFSDDQLLLLLIAEFQSGDALISYLDNIMAMKGSAIVKDKSMFSEDDIEKIMNEESFFHIFGFDSINEINLELESFNEKNKEEIIEQALIPNIIELILAEELLMDRIPLGILSFHLNAQIKESNNNYLVYSFVLLHHNQPVFNWRLMYQYNTHQCLVFDKNENIGNLQFIFNSKSSMIKRIQGILRGKTIVVVNNENKDNYQYKALIGDWRGVISQYRINKMRGKWRLNQTTSKDYFSKFNIKMEDQDHFKVIKHIKVGEDYISSRTIYKNKFPIPISISGFIRNNKFVPPATIPLSEYDYRQLKIQDFKN